MHLYIIYLCKCINLSGGGCARGERIPEDTRGIDPWTRKRRPVDFHLLPSLLVVDESVYVILGERRVTRPSIFVYLKSGRDAAESQTRYISAKGHQMSALLDVCGNDTGSPSISKADDNLSNSDGPLIKGLIRQNSCGSMRARRIGSSYDMSAEKSTKKRYCLWTLTLLLAILGLCNLLLNITVIAVLRISQGMEAIEVIPDENLVKFYGRTDLDKVSLQSGVCQSYGDEPMEISGDEGGIHIDVKSHGRIRETYPHSKLNVLSNGTTLSQVESFEVKDPRTGVIYFTTDFPNFGLPSGVETIDVKIAETYRITSPVNESLTIQSDSQISLHGAEGVRMESKDIAWSADVDIFLKSVNGSIMLDTKDGLFINVKKIPVAPMFLPSPTTSHEQYKVCVCMPQGKLFKVPVRPGTSSRMVNCARVARSPENDPCLL